MIFIGYNQGNGRDKKKIKELEEEMQKADFWGNKIRAQEVIKELGELKEN